MKSFLKKICMILASASILYGMDNPLYAADYIKHIKIVVSNNLTTTPKIKLWIKNTQLQEGTFIVKSSGGKNGIPFLNSDTISADHLKKQTPSGRFKICLANPQQTNNCDVYCEYSYLADNASDYAEVKKKSSRALDCGKTKSFHGSTMTAKINVNSK